MTSPPSGAPRRSPASRSTSSEAPRGHPGRSRWRGSSRSAAETSRTALYSPFVPVSGGAAMLSADSALDLFRGFTSFAQLWFTVGGTVHVLCAPVAIQDSPAYARLQRAICSLARTLIFFSWCATVSRVHAQARHGAELVHDMRFPPLDQYFPMAHRQ
ncbi:hypothetical protein EDB84DRAFT_632164 [Lactarius hengduanensis]|nr:hypothetical protein EDB84DRAFT_632164 [Lactarius hengduanensis]